MDIWGGGIAVLQKYWHNVQFPLYYFRFAYILSVTAIIWEDTEDSDLVVHRPPPPFPPI